MLEWMPITRPSSRTASAGIAGDYRGVADEEFGILAGIEDSSQAEGRRAALLDAAGIAKAKSAGLDVVETPHLDVRPLAGHDDFGEAGIAGVIRVQGLGRHGRPSGKITVKSLPGLAMTWQR